MFSVLAALVTLGGLVNAQGYVTLPFTKETLDSNFSKREVVGNLVQDILEYTVDFSLGNQQQKGHIDTTTSDLWVYGTKLGIDFTYDPSGAELSSNNIEMRYADGSKAEGSTYKDKLTLGGAAVDAEFGVVDEFQSSSRYGTVGLGLLKISGGCIEPKNVHNNLPFLLKNAGQIEAAAYSLNLDPRSDHTGAVVFGAVDKTKYTGKLQILDGQSGDHFAVEFGLDGTSYIGTLNSTSFFTYLPDEFVRPLAGVIGATWNDRARFYELPANHLPLELEFDFAGTTIIMPPSELASVNKDAPSGVLMVLPASENNGQIVLGDSFLRSAYTVYDLENNRVAIAQASRSDSPPNYEAITSAGIPGASY